MDPGRLQSIISIIIIIILKVVSQRGGRTRRAGKGASEGSEQGFRQKTPRKEFGGPCTAIRAESEGNSCCQNGRREDEAGRRRMGPETCFT